MFTPEYIARARGQITPLVEGYKLSAALDEIERLRGALEELRNLSQLELPDDELTHWALHRLITINKISTTALQGCE